MSPESKLLSIQYANVMKSISKLENYINNGIITHRENGKYLLPVKQFLDFICHISLVAPIEEGHLFKNYLKLAAEIYDRHIETKHDLRNNALLTVTLLKVDIFKATSEMQKKFNSNKDTKDMIEETKQLQSEPATPSPNLFAKRK